MILVAFMEDAGLTIMVESFPMEISVPIFLAISSTESDEMMALIMRELKVYPKEESNNARLQAIQQML